MIIYSLPNCPRCKVLKAKLDREGLEYENILIDDIIAKEKNITAAPTLELDDGTRMTLEAANKWLMERKNGNN